jgi:hypothetical protein
MLVQELASASRSNTLLEIVVNSRLLLKASKVESVKVVRQAMYPCRELGETDSSKEEETINEIWAMEKKFQDMHTVTEQG